ncbi:MAG: DUF4349 domain-containing protein [Patescibacteria group bacterium]
MSLLNWVKTNKLSAFLLAVIGFFVVRSILGGTFGANRFVGDYGGDSNYYSESAGVTGMNALRTPQLSRSTVSSPPIAQTANRMTIEDASMSLVVKSVRDTVQKIKSKAEDLNGYMVASFIRRPDEGGSGNISVRVPKEKLAEALTYFKSLSVKIVSENLTGQDITDQFKDNEARLTILLSNKVRFEAVMAKAEKIEDILRVQQEIFNLQTQIDAIKGEQQYLDDSSKFSRIDVSLSEDELSLSYTTPGAFRPELVFKLAVRSLVSTLFDLISKAIWVGVYSVIWLPAFILFIAVRRRFFRKK